LIFLWRKLEKGAISLQTKIHCSKLNSGMRRGELAGLSWDRVDFERNQIEVSPTRDRYGLRETTKTGIRRYVPMNVEARRVLEQLRRKQNHLQYIFVNNSNRSEKAIFRTE
jgi:integrase